MSKCLHKRGLLGLITVVSYRSQYAILWRAESPQLALGGISFIEFGTPRKANHNSRRVALNSLFIVRTVQASSMD